jgi:hypothetical protein
VRTLEEVPEGATHRSKRELAKRVGISPTSVHRIWRAFGLQPWRTEDFKISPDPLLIDKIRDVIGLYLAPSANAAVFAVDEKPPGSRSPPCAHHDPLCAMQTREWTSTRTIQNGGSARVLPDLPRRSTCRRTERGRAGQPTRRRPGTTPAGSTATLSSMAVCRKSGFRWDDPRLTSVPGPDRQGLRAPGLSASRPSTNAPSRPGGIRASRPRLPSTPCAGTRDHLYRQRRRATCSMHDRRDASATAIQEDSVGAMSGCPSRRRLVR